jgi:hypothetical protein
MLTAQALIVAAQTFMSSADVMSCTSYRQARSVIGNPVRVTFTSSLRILL